MSVLLEHPANVVAYRPTKPTAMVVIADPRVRNTVTRHLWALGVRDVIEVSSIAEARPRVSTPRDICVADVHLPDGSGLTILAETRAAGWPTPSRRSVRARSPPSTRRSSPRWPPSTGSAGT
ncbi:hypothetical protein AB0O00_30590, partial [Kitasatospora sp. NPDC093558]